MASQYGLEFKVIESPDNQITAYFAKKRETERKKARKPVFANLDAYKADYLFNGKII